MILVSLNLGFNFPICYKNFLCCWMLLVFSAYLVVFYICVILETKQLCCDLKESDVVAWVINDVLQQFVENTINKKHS